MINRIEPKEQYSLTIDRILIPVKSDMHSVQHGHGRISLGWKVDVLKPRHVGWLYASYESIHMIKGTLI